ncbi:MAG: hypothetical protein ACK4YP_27395, partial [Myxococcota bacterium]
PIRGAGGTAVSFGVERALDALAAKVGLDGFALRARNVAGDAAAVLGSLAPAWADGARGLALARVDGSGGARVVLTVTGPDAIEVQCNVPELGQGRDEGLVAALVAATGLPASTFEVACPRRPSRWPGARATSSGPARSRRRPSRRRPGARARPSWPRGAPWATTSARAS